MVGLKNLKRQVARTGHGLVSSIFDKSSDSRPGEIMVHPSCVFSATGSPGYPTLGFLNSLMLLR